MPRRAPRDLIQLGARVPKPLKERVDAEAARRDMSVSKLVELALERQLPTWENDPRMLDA